MKAVRFAVPLLVVGLFLAPSRAEACSQCTSPIGILASPGTSLMTFEAVGIIALGASSVVELILDATLASNVSTKLEGVRDLATANIVLSALSLAGGITTIAVAASWNNAFVVNYGSVATGIAAFSLGWSIFKLVRATPGADPSHAMAASEGLSPWVSSNRDGLAGGLAFSRRW